MALSRAVTIDGLRVLSFDRVKVSHDAMRFHEAVSRASVASRRNDVAAARDAISDYRTRNHFWWKDVLEGAGTHPGWVDLFRDRGAKEGGTSLGTEFRRWEVKYPVPPNLRRQRQAGQRSPLEARHVNYLGPWDQ